MNFIKISVRTGFDYTSYLSVGIHEHTMRTALGHKSRARGKNEHKGI